MKREDINYIEADHTSETAVTGVRPGEVVIGTVVALDTHGRALVDFQGNPLNRPLESVTTVGITHQHKGRQVALLFANGDVSQPVIMGLVHSPLQEMLESFEVTPVSESAMSEAPSANGEVDDVTIDGKRIVFEGKDEIVLRCGEASITLTRAGKILIRGKYLLNRSTGVNRIMGGSVQVN